MGYDYLPSLSSWTIKKHYDTSLLKKCYDRRKNDVFHKFPLPRYNNSENHDKTMMVLCVGIHLELFPRIVLFPLGLFIPILTSSIVLKAYSSYSFQRVSRPMVLLFSLKVQSQGFVNEKYLYIMQLFTCTFYMCIISSDTILYIYSANVKTINKSECPEENSGPI